MKIWPVLLLFALIAVPFARPTHAGDAPLPLNDGAAPPFKAVYRWGQSGCAKGLYDAYGPWLNRKVIWAEDFMPSDDWNNLEGQEWQMGTWGPWVQKQAGRRLVLSLPMLVGTWDGKGPKKGPGEGVPVSLEEGAEGAYNSYFQHLAQSLVKHGLGDTIIRIGWEFNGGWYIWRAGSADKAGAFAGYFRQIVTAMRSVPGTQNLRFCWNPAMEPYWAYPPEKAWPGDDVVDFVGVDVYDQSWAKDTYPIPASATAEELLARQKRVWESVTNNEKAFGLPFWAKLAAAHKKPLTIPEWGVCARSDGHGGGDNPYYIQQMVNFIYNPANNVGFECYFDVSAPDGDHRLVAENNKESKFPLSASKYVQLFKLIR